MDAGVVHRQLSSMIITILNIINYVPTFHASGTVGLLPAKPQGNLPLAALPQHRATTSLRLLVSIGSYYQSSDTTLKNSTCCASPCVGAEAACTFTFIVPNIYSPSRLCHIPPDHRSSRFLSAKRDLGRDRRVLRPADERACRKIEQGRANAWFWSIELVQALGDGAGEAVVDAQRPRQRPPHFAQLVHALYATAL